MRTPPYHCSNRLFKAALMLALTGIGTAQNLPSLRDVFQKQFLIGAAVNDSLVRGDDPRAAEIVVQQCNTITPENVMKWEVIHPELARFDFNASDRYVAFGEKNHMFIVGHTLVWQNQIPSWAFEGADKKLLGRDAMLARMKAHIDGVVGRYKGRVKGWDVVNEALSDTGGFRNTKWVQTVGPDFIEKAFEYAHAADPDAQLYYNEFSLDKPAKRDECVKLVRRLKAKGLRIDGVGIQGHWGMDYPTRADFDAFVDSVSSLGVKIMVTELDIDLLPNANKYRGADITMNVPLKKELDPYPTSLPDSVQQRFTKRYAELFSMLVDHADKIDRVTFWGVYDGTSWLNYWPVRTRTNYPLLFDRAYRPKPAFEAVIKTAIH